MSAPFEDLYNAAADLLGRNLTPARRDRVAYVDAAGAWTYAALADMAGRFAALLVASGVQREQRVVLCMTDSVHLAACFLGALQCGVVPIPLNTRLMPKDYGYMLADSRAVALVVSATLASSFEGLEPAHTWVSGRAGGLEAALEAVEPHTHFADTRAGEMAFWLYTSGTTGLPKAAVHAHSHLAETARLYADTILQLGPDDVLFSAAKLFFAYGLGNALSFPLAAGAKTILLEGPPTAEAVAAILREQQPSVFFGVPTLFGMLLAKPELLPRAGEGRLRVCVSAGEALPPELLRRWKAHTGVDILDGLGSTEALHIFLSNRAGQVKPGSTGRAVSGYRVRVVDDDGVEVPRGELGHLEVSGPTTAIMYWNQRERTKQTFRGQWMRTGDKYRQDEHGDFFYEGRADDLMKVGGIWVSPFEVESALLEHAAVLECAVVGHADHDALIKPRAFVVCREGVTPDEALSEDLMAFVRERLAAYKRPRWVEFMDALPKTATGKIQRFRLRAMDDG